MEPQRLLLPDRPGEPIGIAGGGGSLPRMVADAAAANGWTPHIVGVGDGLDADWRPYVSRRMPWGQLGDGLNWLLACGVRRLVLCGTVTARPDFRTIIPSFRTLLMIRQIFSVIRGGDDSLLRAAARTFEARGFEVVSVQAIAPALLAGDGLLAGPRPSSSEEAAMERGFAAARALGQLDIGQAVVASRDRVIALEGIEGTREMMERVSALRQRGRIGRAERCVLVKSCKPTQDARFDLPSIGPATIGEAAAAGLAGVAVSAGASLLLGMDDIAAAATRHGVFVIGHRDERTAAP